MKRNSTDETKEKTKINLLELEAIPMEVRMKLKRNSQIRKVTFIVALTFTLLISALGSDTIIIQSCSDIPVLGNVLVFLQELLHSNVNATFFVVFLFNFMLFMTTLLFKDSDAVLIFDEVKSSTDSVLVKSEYVTAEFERTKEKVTKKCTSIDSYVTKNESVYTRQEQNIRKIQDDVHSFKKESIESYNLSLLMLRESDGNFKER